MLIPMVVSVHPCFSWFVTVIVGVSWWHFDQLALLSFHASPTYIPTCTFSQHFSITGLFDRDGNGTIDVREFHQLWQYINQWKGVFDRYDRDRSGNIDVTELTTAFNEMGFRVSAAFCQLVVTRFDRLAKKSLKLDDFIQSCVMLRSLTEAFRARDTNQNGIITVSYEDFMTMAISNKPWMCA